MICNDLPIHSASEDKLNRKSFAQSLAKVLLEYSAPSSFSVGLFGEWGSGKTSLINLVLDDIERIDERTVIVRFNPWLCSDSKQLITQFFKQLARAIKMKKAKADQLWELIDQYADVLDAANAIPFAGAAFVAAGRFLKSKARTKVAEKESDLQGKKDEIVKELFKQNTKIIVAIDDIDRLTEKEIVAVFQLVKSLGDFPNTVYLLAFDYNVVVKALSEVQQGDGKAYLEKIIQVPFEIPTPNLQSIYETLFSKIDIILDECAAGNWDKNKWTNLFQFVLKGYISSIRDVIRFTNVFYLKFTLLKEETNPVDLLGLTAIQVFEPSLYSKLPGYKDAFCGTLGRSSYEKQEKAEGRIKEIIAALITNNESVANKSAAIKAIEVLFPKVKEAMGSFFFGSMEAQNSLLIRNSIAAPECFDRYFSLTLEDEAISSFMMKRLIYEAKADEAKELLEKIYQQGKIVRLLEEVDAYASNTESIELSGDRAALILMCLSEKWHTFEVDDIGFLAIPFPWRFLSCSYHLLVRVNANNRFEVLRDVFDNPGIIPSTLALILESVDDANHKSPDAPTNRRGIISEDEKKSLEQVFVDRAVEAIESREVLNQHNGLSFLWKLDKIEPELASEMRKTLVVDEESLSSVLWYCFSHGMTSIGNSSYKTWGFNIETLKQFFSPEKAVDLLVPFVKKQEFRALSHDKQMSVVAFLLSMSEDNNKNKDNHISEESITRKLKEVLSE